MRCDVTSTKARRPALCGSTTCGMTSSPYDSASARRREALAKALSKLGYSVTRQTGSHMRLTTMEHGEHHITIPRHHPLRVGTLAGILGEVAAHFETSRDELIERVFR